MSKRNDISFLFPKVPEIMRPTSLPATAWRRALAGTALGGAVLLGLASLASAASLAGSVPSALPELGLDAGPRLGVANAASYRFSGTCSENMQAVLLSVRHGVSAHIVDAPTTFCAGGVWQIDGLDLSGLSDGPLVVEAQHEDLAGQRATLSSSLVKGGLAPRVGVDAPALIHPGNLEAYTLSGTCSEEGQKLALTLSDGKGYRLAARVQAQCAGQHWSTTLSGLAALDEGVITLTVTHDDVGFGTATLSAQALKNTLLPGLSIDPLLFVKAFNQTAFPLSGTCSEAQQPVSLAVGDRNKVTVYGSAPCFGKSWRLPLDLSPLSGGELRFVATHANAVPVARTVLQAGLKDASAAGSDSGLVATAVSPATTAAQASSSAPSKTQSLLPTQSITFNSLSNKALGEVPFSVAATASSGLPVSFSSLTPQVCTSTGSQGSTVSLLLLGTCTLQANQAGDTRYAAAVPVAQSFTVGVPTRDAMLGQPAIAAGGNHTIAIKAGGTVWTWGDNERGQLGDGSSTMRSTPVQVSGLSANGVGAGASHSVALKTDGSIVAWGSNDFGQLGNGTAGTTNVSIPVALSGTTLPVFSAIAVGANHSLALSGGEVWAWGANGDGQIGQATTTLYNATPAKIGALTDVIAIAAGANHSLALKSNGTVWAWGRNSQGQLGDNSTSGKATPVQVSLAGVTAIAAGGEHSLALKDGGVWAWGGNWAGQIGDGSNVNRLQPVALTTPAAGVKAIGAGNAYSLALKTDGSVLAWGYGAAGQVGNGSTLANPTPVAVAGVNSGVTALAAGDNHAVAMKTDGTLLAWGYNGRGQLGDGSLIFRQEPLDPGISAAEQISAGAYHVVANKISSPPAALAWGSNWKGQIDDAGTKYRPAALPSTTFSGASRVASGYAHTLKTLGTATTGYGENSSGQQGASLGAGYQKLSAGGRHSLAIDANNKVLAWGSNDAGQLGSAGGDSSSPRLADSTSMSATVTDIAAGGAHSVALSGGAVWVWGSNLFGQLGNGSTTPAFVSTPTMIASLGTSVTKIVAGRYHTVALVNGAVWTWGRNSSGQLGNGTINDSSSPVQVLDVSKSITKIAAGAHHTLAMNDAGEVWVWGRNYYGQLGNATSTDLLIPTKLSSVYAGGEIAAGAEYSVIRTSGGRLQVFGDGRDGELGLGVTATALRDPAVAMIKVSGVASQPALTLAPVDASVLPSSATFSGSSSVTGKIYWVFLRSTKERPNLTNILNGQDGSGISADEANSQDRASAGSFSITTKTSASLQDKAAYRLFVCVVKTGDTECTGNAASVDFITDGSGGTSGASSYPLGVTLAGPSGAGFVTTNVEGSDGAAMYCATNPCSKTYAAGKVVTLLAVPTTGATFTGWNGGGCGSALSCSVPVTAATYVTATFSRTDTGGTIQFPLTSYSAVPGKTTTITISRTGNTDNAASVNIACTPAGANCNLFPSSLAFVAGQSSASFTINVPSNSTGTVQLTLSAGTVGSTPSIGNTGPITVALKKSVGLTPILLLLLH